MLSGGQRQRISLARAILKDAPIVILDEATAYADPENEEKMEAAIAELTRDKTLIVIAHKLPQVSRRRPDRCHGSRADRRAWHARRIACQLCRISKALACRQ